ncbi:maltokinase N-terminal cap-like domain-containing protein [Actinomadura madurae]|uniref:maltokinase N-terminal cap-like domain-containing protein n=1 Tax=Actinomadura madurae TaxID=1993 RepID=UPI0027E2D815|nr:phosphotransferase [Actinomadura madurae]
MTVQPSYPPSDTSLARLLAGWLPRQRWFGGKDGPIDDLAIATATELLPGDPALHHLIIDVHQNTGTDHYQVLLGVRRDLPEALEPHAIGRLDGREHGITGHVYDGAHDPRLTRPLLAHMADERTIGPLRFHRAPGTGIRTDLDAAPASAEQSNTSLIFGDAYICKLFRRLSPGVNPDLEINLALSREGCEHVPAVHGWIELEPGAHAVSGPAGDEPVTLALLSEFLRTATDGWHLALTSVRDWLAQPWPPTADGGPTAADAGEAGGDFAAEAERLGAATAAVHRALADAFGVTQAPPELLRETVFAMNEQLDQVSSAVPQLRPYAHAIRAVFDEVAADAGPLTVQRVHGDYHLGQVLRTETGWTLLDFEGEPPARPTSAGRPRTRCATSPACSARSSTRRASCWCATPTSRPTPPTSSNSAPRRGRSGTGRRSAPATRRRAGPTRRRTPRSSGRSSSTRRSTRSATRPRTGRPGCPSRCGPWPGWPG